MIECIAFTAISQLLNGSLTRASSEESQQKQMEFQAAMQARQWEETARLQREIQALTVKDARENARLAWQRQQQTLTDQAMLASWPFIEDPFTLRNNFQKSIEEGRPIPLQILIPTDPKTLTIKGKISLDSAMKQVLTDIANFLGSHYPHNAESRTPICLRTGLKGNAAFEPSHLNILYEVFHVAPTIVLLPGCIDNSFRIQVAYWDGTDANKHFSPSMQNEVFRCDVAELQIEALRVEAREWEKKKNDFDLQDEQKDELLNIVKEETALIQKKKSLGMTDADVYKYIRPGYERRYLECYKKLQISLDYEVNSMLKDACQATIALLSDLHYLTHGGYTPKFPQICSQQMQRFPELKSGAEYLFNAALNNRALPEHRLPLYHARLAESYSGTDGALAQNHAREGLKLLKNIVLNPSDKGWENIPELRSAVQTLSTTENDQYLDDCLREINCPPNELTERGAKAYAEKKYADAYGLWLRAAQLDYLPACNNLAQLYWHGVGTRRDMAQAAYYFEKAMVGRYQPAFLKGAHVVVTHYLNEGDWGKAFDYCVLSLPYDEGDCGVFDDLICI